MKLMLDPDPTQDEKKREILENLRDYLASKASNMVARAFIMKNFMDFVKVQIAFYLKNVDLLREFVEKDVDLLDYTLKYGDEMDRFLLESSIRFRDQLPLTLEESKKITNILLKLFGIRFETEEEKRWLERNIERFYHFIQNGGRL